MSVTNPVGWLPYGASDSSILLQHPLTSDPTTYFGTVSTYTKQGSGHVFDSTLGFCPNGAGNFMLVGLTGSSDLDYGGQISFQVSRDFVCEDNTANFSSGYIPSSADEYCMSYLPTTGTTGAIGAKATTENFYGSGSLFTALSLNLSSAGKGDYVTVNFGWKGGRVGGSAFLAIDGKLVDTATLNAATLAGAFATLYVGGDRGTSKWMSAGYYLRNLQISTRPPMFAIPPKLRYIAILSDSLCNSDDPSGGGFRDAVTSYSLRQRLAEKGLFAGTYNVSVNGGYRLDNSIPGAYLKDQLPALLANNPTVVVIRGGTNDAQGSRCSQGTWQQSVTDYINDCFATDSVQMVVLVNIPSAKYYTTPRADEVAAGNSKIQAAADAWRDANPSDPREIVVVDAYNRLGGESPPSGTFIGQVDGLSDNLHLSGYGHYLHGRAIADGIISALG